MILEQYDVSLDAYVISQCTSVSDILVMLLFQCGVGVKKPLHIVPLLKPLTTQTVTP